jgi:hypothetical protein
MNTVCTSESHFEQGFSADIISDMFRPVLASWWFSRAKPAQNYIVHSTESGSRESAARFGRVKVTPVGSSSLL